MRKKTTPAQASIFDLMDGAKEAPKPAKSNFHAAAVSAAKLKNKRLYPLSNLAKNEWLDFANYTVQARAIPSMIDGLKPVQRFYLYSSIVSAKKTFKKVSAIGGILSEYGYNHAETSAMAAGQLMAADWNNNICLIESQGSFGTRLVQAAGAPRYTYTRLHENFEKFIQDTELAPPHDDPEVDPPAFYIPVIPLVLANGVEGIATGFATKILPRDPVGVAAACAEYVKTGKIKTRPAIKFPHFTGTVTYSDTEGRFHIRGTFERKGKTGILITEVPYGYDREGYVSVLDTLEEKKLISSYEDQCDKNGFRFQVRMNNGTELTDAKVMELFKLDKPFTENMTVIDENGKLREYDDEAALIADFCNFRMGILQKRIELRIEECTEEARWLRVKMEFILAVLAGSIVFKGKKRPEVVALILMHTTATNEDVDRLLRLQIVSLTQELVTELEAQIRDALKALEFWKTTTPKDQFINDLKKVAKA